MSDWRRIRSLVFVGLSIPGMSLLYKDGPPVGHTGGFGEPTCHSCHFDGPLNSPDVWVGVVDAPALFDRDTVYTLTIAVSRSDLGAAGFSMSSRFLDGRQAGAIESLDDRTAVEINPSGIQFAMHALDGTDLSRPDSMFWQLRWIAPSEADTVVFHVAANAANGDDSELGDLIKTISFEAPPAGR